MCNGKNPFFHFSNFPANYVAFADVCSINAPSRFQATNSLLAHHCPLCLDQYLLSLHKVWGMQQCAISHLLLHAYLPPSASLHFSPQVGFNSDYFQPSCGAQPVGTSHQTSECGKRVRLDSDPLVSSFPGFRVACIPLWELWFLLGSLPHIALSKFR